MAESDTTRDVIAGWVGGAGKKMVCIWHNITQPKKVVIFTF